MTYAPGCPRTERYQRGVLSAIAVQGSTVRVTDDRLPELVALLEKTAHRVAPLLVAGAAGG